MCPNVNGDKFSQEIRKLRQKYIRDCGYDTERRIKLAHGFGKLIPKENAGEVY